MKKIFTLVLLLVSLVNFAQAPQGFNYQATVRNASGALLVNQNVFFKFNIMLNSATSVPVFSETHYVPTDDLGQINLIIGQGTATTGTFSIINWGTGNYYLGIELNTGSGYVAMGTTQLLSVPYALYAQNAGSAIASIPTIQQVIEAGDIVTNTVTASEEASLQINTVGGNTEGSFFYGLKSQIDGTNGSNRAILAGSNGISLGTNTGISSYASNGSSNSAIYARAYNATTGSNYGIYGLANGTTGMDNRGTLGASNAITTNGKNYGITGIAVGSEVFNIAVGAYSELGTTTNGNNYGVSARASSATTTGTNYGIYSEASNGAINYAGFFNGNVTITGALVQPSDKKLKKNIKPFTSALDKINALSPVTYYYKNEKESGINLPTNLQYGFIAQDLEIVFPELVTTQVVNLSATGNSGIKDGSVNLDENTITTSTKNNQTTTSEEKIYNEEFKGINYTGLISVLTEAIKEQQVLIENLKKQNELLAKRMEKIEKKLK